MNLFSASGQSTTIDNETLTKMVRTCEKCKADNKDLLLIHKDHKLILEAQSVRLIDKEETIKGLNNAIKQLKIEYYSMKNDVKKKKFWAWLIGIGEGIVVGAVAVVAWAVL